MPKQSLCIIGGDMRQITVAREFLNEGFKVSMVGFDKTKEIPQDVILPNDLNEAILQSDAIILPLPYSRDGQYIHAPLSNKLISVEDVLDFGKDKIFFGGMIKNLSDSSNIIFYDYYENEELKIFNAIPTAEGALSIALNESTETIHGCKTAVIGFGRIGRILGTLLKQLNSDVTILHRSNKDDAWCSAFGLSSSNIRDINVVLKDKKIIFNTVPHILLTKEVLSQLRKDVIIIDLASSPGGIDYDESKKMGLNVIKALSLPGKLSPVSAGIAIKKSISNIIYDHNIFQGEIE